MKVIVFVAGLLATLNQAWADEGPLLLENPRIAVEIDRQNGAIRSVRDKDQSVTYGKGRRQIQVLLQKDKCYPGVAYRTYEENVRKAVERLDRGRWECVLDTSIKGKPAHTITGWAVKNVILPALSDDQEQDAPRDARKQ